MLVHLLYRNIPLIIRAGLAWVIMEFFLVVCYRKKYCN